jgi:hypothetical protein
MRKLMPLMVCVVGAAHAGTPPKVSELMRSLRYVWHFENDQWKYMGGSSRCHEIVAEIDELGIADTLAVELTFDTPHLAKGSRTLKELKDLCQHAVRAAALGTFAEAARAASRSADEVFPIKCLEFYDKAIAAGHAPTTRLPYEGLSFEDPTTGDAFVGTIEEARKKFCDAKAKKHLDEVAKQEAPYREVLKADKLQVALRHRDENLFGPGRKNIDAPAQLASARVWFRETWYKEKSCGNGASHPYHVERFEFDAGHKLVKQTTETFCGAPPKSAFR